LLIIFFVLSCNLNLFSQQTVTFTDADGNLTEAEVNTHLGSSSSGSRYLLVIAVGNETITSLAEIAFRQCANLTSVDFPNVESIGWNAFAGCAKLAAVSLGTGFTTPTEITLDKPFPSADAATGIIDLKLGKNVLPAPDIQNKTWNGYTWKSVTTDAPAKKPFMRIIMRFLNSK
jgi:hypothetical protein